MKQHEESNNNLLAKIELRYLLEGNLFYLLSALMLGSILFMICCEFIKEIIFTNLTRRIQRYITIGFVSISVTIFFYFIIKFYRRLWRNLFTRLKHVEKDLKEEQDKFAIYPAPYGVFVADKTGKFIEANQAVVDMTGYSKEELLKLNTLDLPYSNCQVRAEKITDVSNYFLQSTKLDLEKKDDWLANQIKYTKEIHNQLFPHQFPEIKDCFMAGLYQPAERIGGDFYYAVELKEKIIFYLADITGCGLDGAFLNVFLQKTINNYLFYSYRSEKEISPAEAAEFITARYKKEGFTADYFISLVLFVMDKETKEVKYTNFGFQVPPLLVKSGKIKELGLTGLPISAAVERTKYDFIEENFKLEAGDKLIVTTDGLIKEQRKDRRYGVNRLKKIIKQYYHLPSELLLEAIEIDFKDFIGSNSHQDDISILALERVEVIDKFELSIASDYELIELVKKEFIKFIKPYQEEIDRLLIGLHEMLANAIEHGNEENSRRKVKIRAVAAADYIKVEIKDEGSGFKWGAKVRESLEYNDFSERGRGIAITKLAFDGVCYNSTGNKVVLYKKR